MSTRGVYTFIETADEKVADGHHVYVHSDNYPTGALTYLTDMLMSDTHFELPRYEADEMAASFVAANKKHGGNIRLMKKRAGAADVEYGYVIWQSQEPRSRGQLMVRCSSTDYWGSRPKDKTLFEGTFAEFGAWAQDPSIEK